jgi:hypothetical protein
MSDVTIKTKKSAQVERGELRDCQATSNEDASLAIYDGTDHVGSIVKRGGRFDAYDCNNEFIGTFELLSAAVRAIPGAQP